MKRMGENKKIKYGLDNLFISKQNINDIKALEYEKLEELLFDVYDKKILIFTSNFSLEELVKK